jgi:hypothetical protein
MRSRSGQTVSGSPDGGVGMMPSAYLCGNEYWQLAQVLLDHRHVRKWTM